MMKGNTYAPGREALVKAVLTAVPIQDLMVLNCPKWVLHVVYKIERGFMLKGQRDVKGAAA